MDDLLLHPRTHAELQALLNDPPHALLLVAPTGFGKLTVATEWAKKLTKNQSLSILAPDEKGTITIEATRTLYQRTRAKQADHQVVIIDHAEAMSTEAQNAFLKLLEEPRAHVTFILTAPSVDEVLQTIRSRVQTVIAQPVNQQLLAAHAKKINPAIDDQTLSQQLFVANGRPAALVSMLADSDVFAANRQAMQRAKQLLSASPYERLALVPTLSKNRQEAVFTLEAMAQMLILQIRRDSSAHLLALADALQLCLARLRQNGNVRAQLTRLFMVY